MKTLYVLFFDPYSTENIGVKRKSTINYFLLEN